MTKTEFYQLHKICYTDGTSTRESKTDNLFCNIHKRYCAMMMCIERNKKRLQLGKKADIV